MEIFAKNFTNENNFTQPFIKLIQQAGEGDTVVFEKKQYHFYKDFSQSKVIHMTNTDSFRNPKKYFAMLLENKKNLLLDGNGAEFVIHGDICSLALLHCENITLKNFTIRYDSPADVELKVKAVNGKKVLFEIPKTTQWKIHGRRITFFDKSVFSGKNYWQFDNDKNSHCGVLHSGTNVCRVLHLAAPMSRILSMKKVTDTQVEINYLTKRDFKVGDVYTFSQNKNRNTCGVFVNQCKNIAAENVEVNYLQGFGWLSQMCDTVSFRNVTFRPDKEHHVSSFADLIHVCGCKGSVTVDSCYFCHPHDDAINIHGAFLRFKKQIDDYTAVFSFVHKQQGGYTAFYKGDSVKFYYRSNLQELPGEYVVESAQDDIDAKCCTVRFDKPLPKEITAKFAKQSNVVAENITYCPDVEIKDCTFNAIPTRGILCTTSGKVKIHGNTFSDVAMAHIFISNDAADWYESGPVRDVDIYENEFNLQPTKQYEQLNSNGVLILPITLGKMVTAPVHKNIRIHNNHFIVGRSYPVKAVGVDGIQVYDNVYDGSSKVVFKQCKNEINK